MIVFILPIKSPHLLSNRILQASYQSHWFVHWYEPTAMYKSCRARFFCQNMRLPSECQGLPYTRSAGDKMVSRPLQKRQLFHFHCFIPFLDGGSFVFYINVRFFAMAGNWKFWKKRRVPFRGPPQARKQGERGSNGGTCSP